MNSYIKLAAIASGAMLLPSHALAECPTGPEDLVTGIQIVSANGTTRRIFRDSEDYIVEMIEYGGESGRGYRIRSKFGFLLVEEAETVGGQDNPDWQVFYDYPTVDLATLGAPAGAEWELTAPSVSTFVNGRKNDAEANYAAFDPEERTWGDCTYAMLLIRITWVGATPGAGSLYIFVPELGFAIPGGSFLDYENVENEPPVSITRILPAQ